MNRRTRSVLHWQLTAIAFITLAITLNFTNHAQAQNCQPGWINRIFPNQTGPSPRYNMEMVYDSKRGVTVLFGGRTYDANSGFAYSNETWEYDGSGWTLAATEGPGPRDGFGMSYDENRGVVVLFGGSEGDNILSDTWEWDGITWKQVSDRGPHARFLPAMAYDGKRGLTILTGGSFLDLDKQISTAFNDLWTWDGATWRNITPAGARPIGASSMAYDSGRDRMIVLGHLASPSVNPLRPETNHVWEWDGQSWLRSEAIGPFRRTNGYKLVYDPNRQRTVFYGLDQRFHNYDNNSTWEWDGRFWYLVSNDGPIDENTGKSGRYLHAMTYDQNRRNIVLFGGKYDEGNLFYIFEDTWEYNGSTGVEIFDLPDDYRLLKRGETMVISVKTDNAIGRINYQWQKNGIDLTDDGRITGTNTDTLTIRDASADDADSYSVAVEDDCHRVETFVASLQVIDPQLILSSDCPGEGYININWDHTSPKGEVAIVYSTQLGSTTIPPGNPCAGTTLNLGQTGLRVVFRGFSFSGGDGSTREFVSGGVCGNYLQLIDLDTCLTSNVVQIQ